MSEAATSSSAGGRSVKWPLAMNISSGLFYGYAIGFVAIYMSFNSMNTDCYKIQSEGGCSTLLHSSCVWVTNGSVPETNRTINGCEYGDWATVQCSLHHGDEAGCASISGCTFDYQDQKCNHSPEWSPAESGIFAGGLILGCMIGSLSFGKISDTIGRKRSLLIIGIICVISCGLMIGARLSGSYPLLIVGRVLLGFGSGGACVVSPAYVEEMSPVLYKAVIGSFFQIAVTFGICIAAILGYAIEPRDWAADKLYMETRIMALIGVQFFLCATQLVFSVLIPESTTWLKRVEDEVSNLLNSDQLASKGPRASMLSSKSKSGKSFPIKKLAVPLIGGFFLGTSLQLTGINAVMNYAPTLTKAANLSPLLGNMVIMIWNFVTTIISIPLAKKFEQRSIYLFGTFLASASCLITGIPIFPGIIEDKTTKSVVCSIGVVLFVGFFECGMGPPFYLLSQRLFPSEHRAAGSSFVLVVQFINNLIINVGFPIAVVGLSGGPSADQDKGIAITFILFGGIGLLCFAVMFKTLFDYDEEKELFEGAD